MDKNKSEGITRRGLVKWGVLGGVAVPAMVTAEPVARSYTGAKTSLFGKPSFQNWTKNVKAKPNELVSPKSLAELQSLVSKAKKVKAVGSGHSFSPCAHTEETMIKTDKLNRILDVDYNNMRVKVEAGIKLYELNEKLFQLGLSLPSLGDVDVQAIAGALATGTHGTSMQWGSFSDESSVHAMELVLADGSVLSVSADRADQRRLLEAARLSLGVLGVVYSVTLNVIKARNLELHSRLLSLEEALSPSNYLDNDHFEFFRFPFTDKVQAITRNTTLSAVNANPIKGFFDDIVLENLVLGGVLNASSLNPSLIPRVMKTLTSLVPDEKSIDRSDKIMTNTRWVRAFEIEHAIPIDRAEQMQSIFAEVVEDFSSRENPFFANFPCECRFIRADKGSLLSPTLGQDSCYFSVTSHTSFRGYEAFFIELERQLLAIGGKPHWGKQFFVNPSNLHEGFDEFVEIQEELDPDQKFHNIYWRKLIEGKPMINQIG